MSAFCIPPGIGGAGHNSLQDGLATYMVLACDVGRFVGHGGIRLN
ncbi:hypothetical protein [Streptomyces canus]|nr:hypothetical protein [Streptomyces canus]MDQ1064722.1 hypothetical protein [Streptomyces canus]